MAYGYYTPDGRLVRIDDCNQQTGVPAEYKGPGFDYHLARKDIVWRGQLEDMEDQARRQTLATHSEPMIWFFAEPNVYQEMKDIFAKDYPSIIVLFVAMPEQRRR